MCNLLCKRKQERQRILLLFLETLSEEDVLLDDESDSSLNAGNEEIHIIAATSFHSRVSDSLTSIPNFSPSAPDDSEQVPLGSLVLLLTHYKNRLTTPESAMETEVIDKLDVASHLNSRQVLTTTPAAKNTPAAKTRTQIRNSARTQTQENNPNIMCHDPPETNAQQPRLCRSPWETSVPCIHGIHCNQPVCKRQHPDGRKNTTCRFNIECRLNSKGQCPLAHTAPHPAVTNIASQSDDSNTYKKSPTAPVQRNIVALEERIDQLADTIEILQGHGARFHNRQ